MKTDTGKELWLDRRGRFQRWILHGSAATFAGDYAGRFPAASNVTVEESGAYEVIEGSLERQRFDLWFGGTVLAGAWVLAKTGETSWSLKSLQR